MLKLKEKTRFCSQIQNVYLERANHNPRYSLRAFARDLKISPSRLNDILKGRSGLSPVAAATLADRLGFTESEKLNFCDEVTALHSRSSIQRKAAQARLGSKATAPLQWMDMQIDSFRAISDWWHFAILELTYLKDFKSEPAWIARRLGVTSLAAQEAIDRLERLGMISRRKVPKTKGVLFATNDHSLVDGSTPSEAIRKFHRQILQRAIQAIDLQGIDQRVLGATVMGVRQDCLTEAKADLSAFRHEFNRKYGANAESDSVYCLALQFFELTQNT